jgi:hypothetical protein
MFSQEIHEQERATSILKETLQIDGFTRGNGAKVGLFRLHLLLLISLSYG